MEKRRCGGGGEKGWGTGEDSMQVSAGEPVWAEVRPMMCIEKRGWASGNIKSKEKQQRRAGNDGPGPWTLSSQCRVGRGSTSGGELDPTWHNHDLCSLIN